MIRFSALAALAFALGVGAAGGAVACSAKEGASAAASGGVDAGDGSDVESPAESSGADAATSGVDEGAAHDAGTTSLEADFGGVKRTLSRAQFFVDVDDAGAERFQIEAHQGGAPECPTNDSPTPDRTLVLAGISRVPVGTVLTKADGVAATFFDFKGDQLGGAPLAKASAVSVTVVAIDASSPPTSIELDLNATFTGGTVKGHMMATYCP